MDKRRMRCTLHRFGNNVANALSKTRTHNAKPPTSKLLRATCRDARIVFSNLAIQKKCWQSCQLLVLLLLSIAPPIAHSQSMQIHTGPQLIHWQQEQAWIQVQSSKTNQTFCEGFISRCAVPAGNYNVTNLSTSERFEHIVVKSLDEQLAKVVTEALHPSNLRVNTNPGADVAEKRLPSLSTQSDFCTPVAAREGNPASGSFTDTYFSHSHPEQQYRDLSTGSDSEQLRNRYLLTGVRVDKLSAAIDFDRVETPSLNVVEINRAIENVHIAGGGIVRLPAGTLKLRSSIILMDNVVIEGEGQSQTLIEISNGPHRAAILAKKVENFAIQYLSFNGNNEGNYAIKLTDARDGLIQCIRAENFDNSVIQLPFSRYVTIRDNTLNSGRDTDGNGKYRAQHGIDTKGCGGPDTCPASERFSIRYGSDLAIYSNVIINNDGYGINSHASNSEIMGNYISNNRWGVKLPQSMNVLFHHNYIGGTNPNDDHWRGTHPMRLYDANDFNVGAAYPNDDIFLFQNKFADNGGGYLRMDGLHGRVWLVDNTFEETTVFVSEAFGSDAFSFDGQIEFCATGQQPDFPHKITSNALEANGVIMHREDSTDICSLNCAALVSEMNADDATTLNWADVVSYPPPNALQCY